MAVQQLELRLIGILRKETMEGESRYFSKSFTLYFLQSAALNVVSMLLRIKAHVLRRIFISSSDVQISLGSL